MINWMVKKILFIAFGMPCSAAAYAQHQHLAKHNMLLYGTDEVFADHIVYNVPHNFQVILEVDFDPAVKQAYLEAKETYPTETFIFLLDSMDIEKINEVQKISGTILRRNSSGQQETISSDVVLDGGCFTVLYFKKLPLSLEAVDPAAHAPFASHAIISAGATAHWNTAVVQGQNANTHSVFYGGACDGETPSAVSIAQEKCHSAGFTNCRLVRSSKSSTKC